jgi:hypothetical protein
MCGRERSIHHAFMISARHLTFCLMAFELPRGRSSWARASHCRSSLHPTCGALPSSVAGIPSSFLVFLPFISSQPRPNSLVPRSRTRTWVEVCGTQYDPPARAISAIQAVTDPAAQRGRAFFAPALCISSTRHTFEPHLCRQRPCVR